MPAPSIEKRIAAVFTQDRHSSDELAALITEVETEAGAGDAVATKVSAAILDPSVVADAAIRGKVEDAILATRLRLAIPKLENLRRAAAVTERSVAWNRQADEIEARRDEVARRMRDEYPAAVAKLVELFSAMKDCDRAIDSLHGEPAAVHELRRIDYVELAARGLSNYGPTGKSIADQVQLPAFKIGETDVPLVWPPQADPLAIMRALFPGMVVV